jgi:hypothetical protein
MRLGSLGMAAGLGGLLAVGIVKFIESPDIAWVVALVLLVTSFGVLAGGVGHD